MFCKKCGRELSDNAVFCPGCGTQIGCIVSPEAGEKNGPVISLNTRGETEKKKKGKWLIPTLVSTFVLAIAAVIAIIWLFPGFGGDLDKGRKPAAENHLEQNQAALKENFGIISSLIRNFYTPKDGSTKNSVHMKVNEDILELLGAQEQFGWLSDVKLSYDVTDKNSLSDVSMKLDIGGNYIASFEYLADKKKGDYWMILPDFHSTPVFADVNPSPDMRAVVYDMLAYIDELETPVLNASEIILTAFTSVEEVKETVTVDEVSQELYILKAQMTRKEMVKAFIDVLEMVKEDDDCQKVLKKVAQSYEGDGKETEIEALIDGIIDELNELMDSDDFDGNEKICLNTYLDAADNLVGHAFIIGDETLFSYLTVTDGEKTGVKYVFDDDISLAGSGEMKGEKFTGTLLMQVEGKDYAELELKAFEVTEDSVTGTVRMIPMDRMMDAIYEGLKLDEAWVNMLKKISFTVDIKFAGDGDMTVVISAVGGLEVATIEFTSEKQDVEDVILPAQYVDKSNDSQMEQWTKEIHVSEKLQNIHDRLENIGMPEDTWAEVEILLKNLLSLVALPV